jgi:hypothetical protein
MPKATPPSVFVAASPSAGAASPATNGGAGAVTATTFSRGHCYTWNQASPSPAPRDVACSSPHLFEAVADASVSVDAEYPQGAPYPSQSDWAALDAQVCLQQVEDFLGYPLDPRGRFAAAVAHPEPGAWAGGARDIWCGIQTFVPGPTEGDGLDTASGDAKGADQALIYPTGTCLLESAAGAAAVTCDTPHDLLSLGGARMPDTAGGEAPDNTQFSQAAGSLCLAVAHAVYGASWQQTPTVFLAWNVIEQDSWQTGTRGFNCLIRYANADGSPRDVTGSRPS